MSTIHSYIVDVATTSRWRLSPFLGYAADCRISHSDSRSLCRRRCKRKAAEERSISHVAYAIHMKLLNCWQNLFSLGMQSSVEYVY